jgi:hypothetical protein
VCCQTAASSNDNSGYIDHILGYSSQITVYKSGNANYSIPNVGTTATFGVRLQIGGTQYPNWGNSK